MTDPARATRLWLAIAVATLWVVSVGGHAEATTHARMLDVLPEPVARLTPRSRPQLLRYFRRGVIVSITTLLLTGDLPSSAFHPEPWLETLDTGVTIPDACVPQQKAA